MSLRALVVVPGDRVRVRGTLVRDGDGDWLDVRRVVPAAFGAGPPRHGLTDLRLVGFDPARRPPPDEREMPNRITVIGVWTHLRLEVEDWERLRWPTGRSHPTPFLPDAGPKDSWSNDTWPNDTWPNDTWPNDTWPNDDGRSVRLLTAQLERARLGVFETVRVGPDVVVVVLAADDPAAVGSAVDPALRPWLCVVPSPYPPGAVRSAWSTLDLHMRSGDWGVESFGRMLERGRVTLEVTLLRITPAIARWADRQPDGLIRWAPTLEPHTA